MLQPKPRFLETSEGPEFLKYDANHENKVILSSYAGDSGSIPRWNYNFFSSLSLLGLVTLPIISPP